MAKEESRSPISGDDVWSRRCFRMTIDAGYGEGKTIKQQYERIHTIADQFVGRELVSEVLEHPAEEIMQVVDPFGVPGGVVLRYILWANDNMDEVQKQIESLRSAASANVVLPSQTP